MEKHSTYDSMTAGERVAYDVLLTQFNFVDDTNHKKLLSINEDIERYVNSLIVVPDNIKVTVRYNGYSTEVVVAADGNKWGQSLNIYSRESYTDVATIEKVEISWSSNRFTSEADNETIVYLKLITALCEEFVAGRLFDNMKNWYDKKSAMDKESWAIRSAITNITNQVDKRIHQESKNKLLTLLSDGTTLQYEERKMKYQFKIVKVYKTTLHVVQYRNGWYLSEKKRYNLDDFVKDFSCRNYEVISEKEFQEIRDKEKTNYSD